MPQEERDDVSGRPGTVGIAAKIIGKADREHPADGVLRDELKAAGQISREQSGEVSRAVFAFYRWLGWLDKAKTLEDKVSLALEFNLLLRREPELFSPEDFKRAAPAWVQQETGLNLGWLKYIQREPNLWLRARRGFGEGVGMDLGDTLAFGADKLADTLRYRGERDLFREPSFHNGDFELQDISSQAVGLICDPQPGSTWWDACAGQGGKTLHLCDLMQGKGTVWASDRAEWRLKKLKQRAARAKAFNYRSVLWDGGARLPQRVKFDGILIDAPCSGLGTWQRNPHARWTTLPEDVKELAEVQRSLIEHVIPALKPGGKLVYSVCTLTRSEGEDVRKTIGEKYPQLKPLPIKNPFEKDSALQESLTLWPHEIKGNGMYICAWTA